MALLVIVGFSATLTNVDKNGPTFSPYDEWVYYDYITKVPTEGFVRQGETIGEAGLEAMACNGDTFGPRGEPCTGPTGTYDTPSVYPQQGLTTADLYTPAYFAPTWAVAKVIQFVTGVSLLTAARAVGSLWLVAGLIMLYLLCREFKLSKRLTLGLGLGVIGLVSTHYAFSYISTDAPSLVAGATVAFLGARFVKSGRFGGWLVAASVIGTLLKVTNIFAVGLVVIMLVIYAIVRRRAPVNDSIPRSRTMIKWALIAAVSSAVAQGIWLLIRRATRVGDGPDQGLSGNVTPHGLAANVFVFFFPRDGISGVSPIPTLLTAPFIVLVMVGIFGWFISTRGWTLNRAWAIATAVAFTVFAPLLALSMQVVLGTGAPVSPRYGQPLAPMSVVAVGMLVRNNLSEWLILAYGAGLSVLALFCQIG
ncbi:hypothetical protein [Lacisediminihabitans changchengi]|uniref:Uncharacterized protein n=1 Tax=Lacisediminihabitans changchengi TaxID=2787634 RepID=A0A934SU09_9MICO|nr:hypothetical protein [Lacisediminihabitans changchengi]MBK4346467.1 hypothetical protein [Lacisediminihabitans changchengi]MBK4348905.1 hypothetical protein [Lacisediminihabitans changchengi]